MYIMQPSPPHKQAKPPWHNVSLYAWRKHLIGLFALWPPGLLSGIHRSSAEAMLRRSLIFAGIKRLLSAWESSQFERNVFSLQSHLPEADEKKQVAWSNFVYRPWNSPGRTAVSQGVDIKLPNRSSLVSLFWSSVAAAVRRLPLKQLLL